jgi:hypothetical protein
MFKWHKTITHLNSLSRFGEALPNSTFCSQWKINKWLLQRSKNKGGFDSKISRVLWQPAGFREIGVVCSLTLTVKPDIDWHPGGKWTTHAILTSSIWHMGKISWAELCMSRKEKAVREESSDQKTKAGLNSAVCLASCYDKGRAWSKDSCSGGFFRGDLK